MEKLILVCCLHGNERYGLSVCESQSLFPFVLANRRALEENKRFIDSDLNRVFPGNEEGNYEERRAAEILEKIKDFDYVLDLHSSSNRCPLFGIITKPNKEKIEFAKKLGLKKLIIMPESFASGKALIDFVKCGISIEIGPHENLDNKKQVLDLIENFAENKSYNEDIEVFEIFKIIKDKADEILIENFKEVKKGEKIYENQIAEFDFIPVLFGEEAYNGILCLAARRIEPDNLYKQAETNEFMTKKEILATNEKLVTDFGASPFASLKDIPDCYTFTKGLIYSHRDFDRFYRALKKGEKCAIVSGVNASGTFHIGHKVVFDTNLYFQQKFDLPIFIPISDDESYVSGKVKNQEEALKFSKELARELIAYGFNPKKTYLIIDQIYTNIYNFAIKLSRKINYSEIKATYGYKPEENIGLHFYPAVQSAHILFPQEKFNIKNVLVPIGPDEDAHIRICRDVAPLMGYEKPSILHLAFLPGTDGEKMSKSRNNAIFLKDDEKTIAKKVGSAFSGGQKTIEEHRKLGGNPDVDVSFQYLSNFFLDAKESKKLYEDYKSGKILSGEIKKMLSDKLIRLTKEFQKRVNELKESDFERSILKN